MAVIRVRFMGALKESVGMEYVDVEAGDWVEALLKVRNLNPRLSNVIDANGEPRPGYIVFVDGVDYRIAERGLAREIVILPVVHGGSLDVRVLTWDDIVSAVAIVVDKVRESGFRVDAVIGILRGGIIPATLIADMLGVEDLGVIDIKFYQAPGVRRDKPYLKQPLILPVYGKNVLIVDDVSDTGLTLQLALDVVRHYSPRDVRTATLYIKPWTRLVPDYYAELTDKWLVFPWGLWEYKRFKEGVEVGG